MKTVHTIIKTTKDLKKEDFLFLVYSQSFSNFLFCCHWSLSAAFVTLGLNWKKSSGLQPLQQLCSCHTCATRWFMNDSKDCWFEGGLYFLFLFFKEIGVYLFIYLWLCWVFVSVRGLSPVAASGGHSSSRCAGLSLSRPLLLRSTGSRRAGSAVVAHGPSCSMACGILPDQGPNPCSLHWQADS